VDAQSVSRQQLDKHFPVNTQQWKLCSLWAMLQLVARRTNTADNGSDWFSVGSAPRPLLCNGPETNFNNRNCFLFGPCCDYVTRAVSGKFRVIVVVSRKLEERSRSYKAVENIRMRMEYRLWQRSTKWLKTRRLHSDLKWQFLCWYPLLGDD
jgi:hypothetical protein